MKRWFEGTNAMPRTGESSLTDDELLVCDFVFCLKTSVGLLYTANLAETFNLEYTRAFSKLEMDRLLSGLIEKSVVVQEQRSDRSLPPFIALTPTGGELWERER